MEGCFTFQWEVCFSDGGGFIFKWGCAPWRGIGFDRGFSKKIVGWGGHTPPPPPQPTHTMGNSDFLGNIPLVTLMDQWRRQMEVVFYARCCMMGSGVGILARKFRLAMTVVVESWITHYGLQPSNFHCLDCFSSEKHFSFLSVLV